MKKWNYATHEYEDYQGPAGAMLFTIDMDAECECAQCGEKMKFGDGYVSMEVHNSTGFGYCVCSDCFNEELGRRFKAERGEQHGFG